MFDFVTRDSFQLLRRVPSGVGQAAGIAGNTFAPILGEYFWDDVWQGNGIILQRGGSFLDDVFSMKTLTKGGSNLLGGIWESVRPSPARPATWSPILWERPGKRSRVCGVWPSRRWTV